jgi:hypothetical protein
MPKKDTGVIAQAAKRAERVIPPYPTHFHSVEDGKKYIGDHCEKAGFDYCPRMKPSNEPEARDKVHYLVAVRAFQQGEFYLEVPLVDRGELRGLLSYHFPLLPYLRLLLFRLRCESNEIVLTEIAAIESDIQRTLPLLPSWPASFSGVENAKKFIASFTHPEQFTYTDFSGMKADKFRGFVNHNTVRHAYEAGAFTMQCPGKGWVVKGIGKARQPQMPMPMPVTNPFKILGGLFYFVLIHRPSALQI